MPWFSADLHLHSCLSPCGSLESSPAQIAKTALEQGLDLIALSDHNSALNCPAFAENCHRVGIAAIFGLEVSCAEEAHCLCLFPTVAAALEFGEQIYQKLIPVANDPERWGDQIIVNADEEIEGEVDLLLVNATSIGLEALGDLAHEFGGLFIPAHVDRSAFSLMSQLGFVPAGNYDALEIVRPETNLRSLRLKPRKVTPDSQDWAKFQLPTSANSQPVNEIQLPALICDSDAHYPEDIGKRRFQFWSEAPAPDFDGLRTALRHAWVKTCFPT